MTEPQFTGHTTYGTLGGIITIILVNIHAGDLLKTTVLAAVGAVVSYWFLTDAITGSGSGENKNSCFMAVAGK